MNLSDGVRLLHLGSVHLPNEESEAPSLLGSRCGVCTLVVFPALPVCPRCAASGQMAEARIGRSARLYSHSIAHVAPQGFLAPYYQAFVDLPEGPRVFTLVGREVPVEPGQLVDGAEMRLIVEPLADTPEKRHLLTYKYVPVQGRAAARPSVSGAGGAAIHA
jgi:uncharacterized OB-fold protein